MKKIFTLFTALSLLLSLAACGGTAGGGQSQLSQSAEATSPARPSESQSLESQPSEPQSEPITKEEPDVPKMDIIIGEKTFSATLYDNAAAKALLDMLPMTLEMSELGGNEKYYYLDGSLPADSGRPAGIHTGDIMLYGDNCLVLFYQSFSTSYSYTFLGRVDDPEELAAAVGSGDIQVTFRRAE